MMIRINPRPRCSGTLAMLIVGACLLLTATAHAQLRIVSYNTANGGTPSLPRAGMDIILQAIGEEQANGIAKPIDVMLLQEQANAGSTTQSIANQLNNLYGTNTYQIGTLNGGTIGGGRPGVVYNSATVALLDQDAFGAVSTSAQPRQTLRYEFQPVGYGPDARFVAYSSHMKAGTDGSDRTRRNIEATGIRQNADAAAASGMTNLLLAGDLNVQGSTDPGYTPLTALTGNPGRLFDPIQRPGTNGNWSGDFNSRDIHTQSPAGPGADASLVSGGMDDRFDHQMVSLDMFDREGLAYIPNTYRAFANNGSTFNDPINSGNTAPLTGVSSFSPNQVFDALATVSDHLPVVADYQVPASMSAGVSAPPRVIVGAAADAVLTVENDADVVAPNGADELDYNFAGTAGLIGSGSGTDPALGGANTHLLAIDTAAPGPIGASVDVTATGQATANPTASLAVNVDVLDSSNASFAAANDQNTLTLDFGTFAPGSGTQTLGFDVHNLVQTAGFTAALDLDSFTAAGDTATLSTDLSPFSGLAAGSSRSFTASFDTGSLGSFASTYTLDVSDENLPGEQSGEPLTLALLGEVATLEPDFTLALEFDAEQVAPGDSGTLALKARGADGDEAIASILLDILLSPGGGIDIDTSALGSAFNFDPVILRTFAERYTLNPANLVGPPLSLPAGDSVLLELAFDVPADAPIGTQFATIDLESVIGESNTELSDAIFVQGDSIAIVPEPGTVGLLTLGIAMLARRRPTATQGN